MTSCFTGIESTPRISAKEIRKQKASDSPEKLFLADLASQPTSEWRPGKKFIVTDPRVDLIFERSTGIAGGRKTGDTLELTSIRPALSITGERQTLLDFVSASGDTLLYRTNIDSEEFGRRNSPLLIPFTVEASLIDSASSRLVGNTYYILPQRRVSAMGRDTVGLRYVPVRITSVSAGDAYYPLRIHFSPDDSSLLMTVGNGPASTRNFETLFAFDDPRKSYPQISDDNWSLITNSRVVLGMTPQEARLALGPPNTWSQRPSTAGMVERWAYEDGVYLIFVDGLLSQFRR